MKRNIIKINEKKCNGCGLCIPNCPEGALQIIDGKVRLISDLFCDGLGACIGHCPEGAISIVKREAEQYDEKKVMENIIKHGENTIRAHLEHLEEHNEIKYLNQAVAFLKERRIKISKRKNFNLPKESKIEDKNECKTNFQGCPGSRTVELKKKSTKTKNRKIGKQVSELMQWPVQLDLVSPYAPYFDNSDLLVSADCVPFAYANFHSDILEGKSVVIGCPKLDETESYKEKLKEIIKSNNIKSITIAIMEVPCCFGLQSIVEEALKESGKNIPLKVKIISIRGKENK